jgi:glycosyltransferase involved in cell wall biosynthesis
MASGRPAVTWNIRQSLYDLKAEKLLTRQVIRSNRLLSGGVDTIIYNSRLSRSQHETFGIAGTRAVVIPNGFDLEHLRPELEMGTKVRQEFGLPAEATIIGHVARFHPMKDHASFLRAAVRVARGNPSAYFLLVGREVSPDNPALNGIVPPEFLERFVFTGERGDPHRLMQAMDVLATSSAWGEAFPNVIGEAMACGIPCVTTNVGDSADIVGDTGLVVPPFDTDALAGAMENMIRKNPEARRALGQSARKRVGTHYSLDSVVQKYTRLYQKLSAQAEKR